LPDYEGAWVAGLRIGSITIGKVGYAVACVVSAITLVVAGAAHEGLGLINNLGDGASLGSSPSTGAMNILVMGLESRTNFQCQKLSVQQLTDTHSGSESAVAQGLEGSQDTDTLILIHIFAGGQKASGYSIPRDDVVNYPHATYDGLTEGKIDAAYAYAYTQSMSQNANVQMSQQQRCQDANQAGELFEVQTVESVTGVHIDNFIVSNIIGFYELSQQFGGLEVCIQAAPASAESGNGLGYGANLTDYDPNTDPLSEKATNGNSGFNAVEDGYNTKKGGKQYLHLSAAQSLAYVRSRDTLPGVDVGRTARQQAAIEYILWKLETGGVLGDLGQITTLLSNAKSYLEFDQGWNLIDFASDMRALTGSGLHFTTLPEISTNGVDIPGLGDNQSADYIDEPQIQQEVNQAFYGAPMIPSSASQVTVDVYNGSGTSGLAGEVSHDMSAMGYKAGTVADATSQSQKVSAGPEVFYGSGAAAQANATVIANVMGDYSGATSLSSLPAGQVEVLLGSQVDEQAPGLEMFGADTVDAADYVNAAEQNNQSVPAGVQAAANVGSSSDVPAYSETKAPSPSSSAPSHSAPSHSGSSGSGSSTAKKSNQPTSKKAPSSSAKKPASTGPTSNPGGKYGLLTCPY
jgi:anionic cell wall polymer biosynthesis LytR-Cps2A-Psr (LCP) family protein